MSAEAIKINSFHPEVCMMCLYTSKRFSAPNSISTNSFETPCLMRGGSSVLKTALAPHVIGVEEVDTEGRGNWSLVEHPLVVSYDR